MYRGVCGTVRIKAVRSAGAATVFFLAMAASEQSVTAACPGTVAAGESETTTQTIGAGETCTIEQGGSIDTAAGNAINATGPGFVVINNGLLDPGNANGNRAIFGSPGNDATLSGSVFNTGIINGNNQAIRLGGDIETLVNGETGTIEANLTSTVSSAVRTISNLDYAENHGRIAGGSLGIWATQSIGTLLNSGTIVSGEFVSNTQFGSAAVRSGANFEFGSGQIGTLINYETGRIIGGDGSSGVAAISNSGLETEGFGTIGLLINEGLISGGGDTEGTRGQHGVYADLEITSLLNGKSGLITGYNTGVLLGTNGTLVSLTNHGTIIARNQSEEGVGGASQGVGTWYLGTLENHGTINGGKVGVAVIMEAERIVNTGSIIGGNRDAIRIFGDQDGGAEVDGGYLNSLHNTGYIAGGNSAILARGIGEITNSGKIWGQNGIAILEEDEGETETDTVLNLLAGSNLEGLIDLGGGDNILNVGAGLNMATTFAEEPIIGDIAGPHVVNPTTDGSQVIVVDPTGFAAAQVWLGSITNSIFNAIDGSVRSDGIDGQEAAFSLMGDGRQIRPVANVDATGTGHRFWGAAFGGSRDQEGSGATVDLNETYGGMLLGIEGIKAGGLRIGAFAGGSTSQIGLQSAIQDIEVSAAFGGLYVHQDWTSHWVRAVVTGGWADHETTREIANNLVDGGIETAQADYDGYFVSPAITLGGRLDELMPDNPLLASVRVHYAGLFIDAYSETGVSTPLTISDQDVHLVGARAQFALPFLQTGADGAQFNFESRIGIDAQFNLGGPGVEATVAGLPLEFTASFEDEVASGFVGASISRISADGHGLFRATTEAHLATDGSHEIRAQLAAGLTF